ncbi:conserved hypothetical protein [Paraburkholderia sacchari]|uniref:hypothetical protein n=1 Tax=Paraburkholderia sacchari TaxID=159450 RepID=UPI0039A6C784
MKFILTTWQAFRLVGDLLVRVMAFLLWSAIAAGAGWMLVHLPDVWYEDLQNQSSTGFAVAAITAYAFVAGAFFLEFSCGVVQMLVDVYRETSNFAQKLRSRRAASIARRRQPLFIRKARFAPSCPTSPARKASESTPKPVAAGMPGRQQTAGAGAATVSARTGSRPT